MDSEDILRTALISGLTGFAIFCASYSFAVWRRRNKSAPGSLSRFGLLLVAVGTAGSALAWTSNAVILREGVIEGDELFVVKTKGGAGLEFLHSGASVQPGDILAKYRQPGLDSRISALNSRISEAQSRLDAVKAQPLPVDPMLFQSHTNILFQTAQATAHLSELQRSRRDIERTRLTVHSDSAREKSEVRAAISTAHHALKAATGRLVLAQAAVRRAEQLTRTGVIPVQVMEERKTAVLTVEMEREDADSQITRSTQRLTVADAQYARQVALLDSQISALDRDIAVEEKRIIDLAEQRMGVEALIAADRSRAQTAADSDFRAGQHLLAALHAEKEEALAPTVVHAPYAGTVVYRHSSPSLAGGEVPVLAISAGGSGFAAKVRLPARELPYLEKTKRVLFATDAPVLQRTFAGIFERSESSAVDARFAIAHFHAELPPEAATLLVATGNRLPVNLRWSPDILGNVWFCGSLGVLALGVLCLALMWTRSKEPRPRLRQVSAERSARAVDLALTEEAAARLRLVARQFHNLTRNGQLDAAAVHVVARAIDEFGMAAVAVLQREMRFDAELRAALALWRGSNAHQELDRILGLVQQREAPDNSRTAKVRYARA